MSSKLVPSGGIRGFPKEEAASRNLPVGTTVEVKIGGERFGFR